MMQVCTLSEPVSCRFLYGINTTRVSSIVRSRKHPSAAVLQAPHERKACTGCRAREVSKKSKSHKRYHSLYSRGPHKFKACAGCCSRDVLKESHPTFPRTWHRQKACVGSELGTKSGKSKSCTGFWTEARATAITNPHALEAPAGLQWKSSLRAKIHHILENT